MKMTRRAFAALSGLAGACLTFPLFSIAKLDEPQQNDAFWIRHHATNSPPSGLSRAIHYLELEWRNQVNELPSGFIARRLAKSGTHHGQIHSAIEQDFRKGDTLSVGGVLISKTEAALTLTMLSGLNKNTD
ncbi:MAG: hypothetical protein AAGI88_13145 [Pseudomonadota bacterium]